MVVPFSREEHSVHVAIDIIFSEYEKVEWVFRDRLMVRERVLL